MLLNVSMVGDKELLLKLKRTPASLQAALYAKSLQLALMLEAYIKTSKLNGQVLNRISGALARSINNKVERTANGVLARVFSSGDVKYAGIHEYGGVINHPGGTAYIVNPKMTHMMMFVSNKTATSEMPRTKPHDIRMPERSFLRSSLRDQSVKISTGLKEAVVKAAQETMR